MIYENTPTLETERLILRKFSLEDLQDLFILLRDKEVNLYLPWFPIETLNGAERFLQNEYLNKYNNESEYKYAICLKINNRPIGYCGLSGENNIDLGYALRKEYWNMGLMTEATTAIVNRIKMAGYKFITATHDVNNPNSGKVMQRLGMTYKYTYIEQVQPKNIQVTFRMYQLNFDGSDNTYMEYWNKYENHYVEDNVNIKEISTNRH